MKCVLEMLEKTCRQYPDKEAVEDIQSVVTFSRLAEMSKRIGSLLAEHISKNEPVIVIMEKSILSLASEFGVVYAGGFYIPVSIEQPVERVNQIISVLNAKIIVTDNTEKIKEFGFDGIVINVMDGISHDIDEAKLGEIRKEAKSEDPLYGIFTSGSTGTPKCVIINNGAVISFIGHFTETFGINKDDVIANQAPFDFDVSVKDIYSGLYTGAKVVLIPKKYFSMISNLLDFLIDKQATVIVWAVSAMCMVSGLRGFNYKVPDKLRLVMFSGEVMQPKQLRIWQDALPDVKFVNLYGPSEITCNCTYHVVERKLELGDVLPIGIPFDGREVFILDENNEIINKTDEEGEICVAGESISDGYYNNTVETEKHFVTYNGKYVYKTGDMGYFGENGELYFCGRRDFQIKHMGHRIELEEVDHAISQIDGVSMVCCIYIPERNRIISYYSGDIDKTELHKEAKSKLPGYMLPKKFIQVDTMPLNKNGKIDRNALRTMEG